MQPMLYALCVLITSSTAACSGSPRGSLPSPPAGVLAGLSPMQVEGVRGAERLNDGLRAADGDSWKTELTAVFSSSRSFVEFDLGEHTPLRAAFLQGDNNDQYVLSVSDDGQTFAALWRALPEGGGGQRGRASDSLNGGGRYVRISARGGDGKYSVSELALYSKKPSAFPPRLRQRRGLPAGERLRTQILLFGLALATLLFITWKDAPRPWKAVALLVPVLAGYTLLRGLEAAWPIELREVSMVRATAAAVAGLAVLREVTPPARLAASRLAVFAVLTTAAAMAMAAFYNLGHPQFVDHRSQQPTWVHYYDLRVYYPVAKYFDELGFRDIYQASVAAYVADDEETSLESVRDIELRDLRTHRLKRVGEVMDEIRDIEHRFFPERWQSFKADMRYFRELMGVHAYLGSMKDHGANATPVWLAIAHLIFARTNASDATMLMGAVLDPLLLLLMFIAIGRSFGLRTMLVTMVLFGANDFYMSGSNWAGATLRHDWMAYLGLGICALKKHRWMLGGALLALGAMIRAFPAMALIGMTVPALWWAGGYLRQHRKLPGWRLIREEQRPLLRAAAGAVLCAGGLFLFSGLVLSFDAWGVWLAKVISLEKDPHFNNISIRTLVAGCTGTQSRLLEARLLIFVAVLALYTAAIALACRGKRLDQAATLGLLLIFAVFNPANYYVHVMFLFGLLAIERNTHPAVTPLDASVWCSMLAVCVMQYWTVLEQDLELHFQFTTAIFAAGLSAMLFAIIRRDVFSAAPPQVLTGKTSPARPDSCS